MEEPMSIHCFQDQAREQRPVVKSCSARRARTLSNKHCAATISVQQTNSSLEVGRPDYGRAPPIYPVHY
eukprot:2257247-Pleurochrysis_carterae.AAC.2